MRLTDWKKHAKNVKASNGNRYPKTYSSMKSVMNNTSHEEYSNSFTNNNNNNNNNKNAQILMLLERVQKENDQLKAEVIDLTKRHSKVKEESDLLLEIMADERSENRKLEKEILQLEQFSADVQLKNNLEAEIEKLISINKNLQMENQKLKDMKANSDEQLQFYQNALVRLKATTAKSVSPISTHHSTTNLSQRLLNLKSEFAKSQMKYNKNTEEYRERTERLVQERNALKEQLQLLSRKYDANNNNDYDENENQVKFLETKLKLAEKTLKEQDVTIKSLRNNIIDNNDNDGNKVDEFKSTNCNKNSTATTTTTDNNNNIKTTNMTKNNINNNGNNEKSSLQPLDLTTIFSNFIKHSKHQIHSIPKKQDAIDSLLTSLKKKHHNFNEQLINIFSSHVNIADILFSINRFIKTSIRSCKSFIVVSDQKNGDDIFQFSDQGPSILLRDSIICFHLFVEIDSIIQNITTECMIQFISNIALSRLFLDGLPSNLSDILPNDTSPTEWKWYTTMREALDEIGMKCLNLLPSSSDRLEVIFGVLLLPQKSTKNHVPGSPRRKTLGEGVDDGTNVPRFLSDVTNALVHEYGAGGVEYYFKDVDIGTCLTLYSKVVQSKSLGGVVAAEEILYLAISTSTKKFLNFTQNILNEMKLEEESKPGGGGDDDTTNHSTTLTVQSESEKEILLHVRDLSLDCLNEHMSAMKIQNIMKKHRQKINN